MRTCPTCSRANPDSALRCDCGHSFGSVLWAAQTPANLPEPRARSGAGMLGRIGGGILGYFLGAGLPGGISAFLDEPMKSLVTSTAAFTGLAGIAIGINLVRASQTRTEGQRRGRDVAPPPAGAGSNYLVRHWRGQLPLWVSYWVNGVLMTLGALLFVRVAALWSSEVENNYVVLATLASAWLATVGLQTWLSVGIWRSASRPGADGNVSSWGPLAKVGVVLGIARLAFAFGSEGRPALATALEHGRWLEQRGRWTIRVLRDGTELELTGGIGPGFARELAGALDRAPAARLVHLNLASGGLVLEAQKGRDLLAQRGLSTYVSASCQSACTVLFMGGRRRYLKKGAQLGFHVGAAAGMSERDLAGVQRKAWIAAGVSADFAERVVKTPVAEMWFPTEEELVQAGVVTEVTSGADFALSTGAPAPNLEQARTALEQQRLYRAIKGADAESYERLLRLFQSSLAEGKSAEQVQAVAVPIVHALYAKALPISSDETILRHGRLLVKQLTELQTASPADCLGFLKGGAASVPGMALVSDGLKEEALEVMADAIESAVPGRSHLTAKEVRPLAMRAVKEGRKIVGRDVEAFSRLSDPTLDPALGCRAALGLYSGVQKLPAKDGGRLLRAMLAAR